MRSAVITASLLEEARRGAAIHADPCAVCHAPEGRGVSDLIVEGAASVSTSGAPMGPGMPAFGWDLDDRAVASLATYIRNAWGNAAPEVTPALVARERAELAKRPD